MNLRCRHPGIRELIVIGEREIQLQAIASSRSEPSPEQL